MTMMKAVIYTRVSTASQLEGTSLDSQADACRLYAKQHDLAVAKVAQEIYSGGSLHERPALSALRDELRSGYYKDVICYAVDRLSRKIGHLMILLDEWERFGVRIHFVTETLDNSPEGKLLQSVRGYVAEVEREKIRERTMRGRKASANNGTLSYRRNLFGYRLGDDGRRYIDEHEGELVRRVFDKVLDGHSLRSIAADFNHEGITTAKGSSTWWAHSVKSMVNNPAYTGRTVAFRYKHTKRFVGGVERKTGGVIRDKKEWVDIPDITPAIVDNETFEQAQRQLQINRKAKRGEAKHEFLLRGFIRCGTCGRFFTPQTSRNSRRYSCTSIQNKTVNCHTKSLNALPAELAVWGHVIELINGYAIETPKKKEKRLTTDPIKTIDDQVHKLELEMTRIVDRSATADERAWEMFDRQIKKKADEIAALEKQRDKLNSEQRKKPNTKPLKDIKKMYKQRLNNLPFHERAAVLQSLGLNCIWDGTTLDIHVDSE